MNNLLTIGDRVWFSPGPESDAPDEPLQEERIGTVKRILRTWHDGVPRSVQSVPWIKGIMYTHIETADGAYGIPLEPVDEDATS